jgi:sugar/nucleoside kinase (ribokinase family)
MKIIYCGFSANPELHQLVAVGPNEKDPVLQEELFLSGSTVNVAECFKNMGLDCHPLILTAVDDEILNNSDNQLLVSLLHQNQFTHTHFVVLDQPNKATIEKYNNGSKPRLKSKKGTVKPDLVDDCVSKIEEFSTKVSWAVCTGLQLSEKDLGIALFKQAIPGKRFLVPKPELIKNTNAFSEVLKFTDIVQMNESEFELYESQSPSELFKKGPRILIITKDKQGGEVYLKNGRHFSYNPFILDKDISGTVGAGDWFTGGFVTYLEEVNSDAYADLSKIKKAADFAAQVSAKKLFYQGGSKGPLRSEIT